MHGMKFIKYFGLSFVILGAALIVAGCCSSYAAFVLIPCGLVFAIVGMVFFLIGRQALRQEDRIRQEGEALAGKIVAYDMDPHTQINGQSALMLLVRYFDSIHQAHEILLATHKSRAFLSDYPIGSTAHFHLLDNKGVLDGPPSEETLFDEDWLLLSGDFSQPLRSSPCPRCGTVVTAPGGLYTVCVTCGDLVRVMK